jgi:hypothetical protein
MPTYNMDEGSVHWDFFRSRAKIQFMGGGYGNGKTTASVVLKALVFARDYPGSSGLIARATYPKLNDTIRKEFFNWSPPDLIWKMPTIDDNTCYLNNGSIINFRYVAQRGTKNVDGTTTSNLLSATYDWIIVDQIEDPEITFKDLLDLMGRLRGSTPYRPGGDGSEPEDPTMPSSGPRFLVLTANPTGNWVYSELVKPLKVWQKTGMVTEKLMMDDDTQQPVMELFEGPTMINEKNLPPDYIKGLKSSYKGQMFERFVMGKWASYEGLIYADWSEDNNLLTQDQIMTHVQQCLRRHVKLKAVEAYDFGLTSPTCYGLGFVDDWSRVFLIDGFYKPRHHYTEHPVDIERIRSKWHHLLEFESPIRADPAIWKTVAVGKVRQPGETMARLLTDLGLRLTPANNEILSGIAKVGSYIAGNPVIPHVVTGDTPGPLLYVSNHLEWFTNEVTGYYWKKSPLGENIDEPQEEKDHAMDMIKYMLSKQPDAASVEIPKHLQKRPWMFWHEERESA